jgi:deoxyribodipyrimidine photo-lyase
MNILWFRRDLRLADNESFSRACSNNAKVLPCLVVDPWLFEWHEISPARLRFWFDAVQDLDRQLKSKGSRLILLEGRSAEEICALGNKLKAEGHSPQLFFNRDMQEESDQQRDAQVIQFCQEAKIPCQIGLSNFLQIVHRWDDWYKEYYDYVHQPVHEVPESINTPKISDLPEITIEELVDKYSHHWNTAKVYFPGGESAAAEVLRSFLVDRFPGYHWKISRPWLTQQGATSHLSPHFAWGTISIRTVYQQAEARANQFASDSKQAFSLKAFRLRLRWQCSFSQRFYLHPEIAYQNRFPEFDQWYQDAPLDGEKQQLFQAWQDGETGFPLIDASMRQLKVMGWMNFRMRAMCATFLTINCGISWHHGALHFMQHLVDGDLAIDHWQWQMQAGITNPLSETFRIYNPAKNLAEQDPDLEFVRFWVPELRGYSLEEITQVVYLSEAFYPEPIVDLQRTRKVNGKVVADLRKQVRGRLEQVVLLPKIFQKMY